MHPDLPFQDPPKFTQIGILVRKYAIWQPCSRPITPCQESGSILFCLLSYKSAIRDRWSQGDQMSLRKKLTKVFFVDTNAYLLAKKVAKILAPSLIFRTLPRKKIIVHW
jgi:hypothetical protein